MQPMHKIQVCAWIKTVGILQHPGHFTSHNVGTGALHHVLPLNFPLSSFGEGWRRSFAIGMLSLRGGAPPGSFHGPIIPDTLGPPEYSFLSMESCSWQWCLPKPWQHEEVSECAVCLRCLWQHSPMKPCDSSAAMVLNTHMHTLSSMCQLALQRHEH